MKSDIVWHKKKLCPHFSNQKGTNQEFVPRPIFGWENLVTFTVTLCNRRLYYKLLVLKLSIDTHIHTVCAHALNSLTLLVQQSSSSIVHVTNSWSADSDTYWYNFPPPHIDEFVVDPLVLTSHNAQIHTLQQMLH